MRKVLSQHKMVIDYLKAHKTITSQEAFKNLGVTRLSAIIYDLKHQQGYNIQTYTIHPINRFGTKCNCAEYHLIESED